MVDNRETALAFPRGELRLEFCHTCGFVQNGFYDGTLQSYSPAYEETQAFSPRFMEFLEQLVDDQIARHGLRDKRVLEIGCGKGEFLVLLCERGNNRGIGIDPGYRPDRMTSAAKARIHFIQDHYAERYAELTGDYVACRHTLEHIGSVHAFVSLIRSSLQLGTPVFFELPDLERILNEQAFWDIYYEHCSYFTLGSLARLFSCCGFTITRLAKEYGGQYLVLDGFASDRTGTLPAAADELERTRLQIAVFRNAVAAKRNALEHFVGTLVCEGKRLAIWGSGSKAVSLLTSTSLSGAIAAVIDINPHKHGKYLAGTGHEILSPAALSWLDLDYVLVMNPIYVGEIRKLITTMGLCPKLVTLEEIQHS
jgi:SAM-dependent methyltransferase